jgi:hypothetical protein
VFLIGGLGFLFFWRLIIGYGCCGCRLPHMNHVFLMYLLVIGLGLYGGINFIDTVAVDYEKKDRAPVHKEADLGEVWWLRAFLWFSPIALLIVLFFATEQAMHHMYYIGKNDSSMWRHDRAVLIIAMPAVFGVMMLNSTVPVYQLAIGESYYGKLPTNGTWEERKSAAVNLKNGYFFVADLYEAWAFFQFGLLVLELVESGLRRTTRFHDEARQLLSAMSDLMWLGPWLFILVCLFQAGFSVFKQLSGHLGDEEFLGTIERFEVAGFVASSAAIYNVHIVESRFGMQLRDFRPLFKFFSVKVLISLSFGQSFVISSCQKLSTWQPDLVQNVVTRMPFIGDILNLTDVQMFLFYPTLMTYECMIVALLHSWAWDADEAWYNETMESILDTPLDRALADDPGELKHLLAEPGLEELDQKL